MRPGIVRFVSVLSRPSRAVPRLPVTLPSRGRWLLKVLARDDDGGGGYNFALERTLPPGEYLLKVRHCCAGVGTFEKLMAALLLWTS